MTFVVAGYLFLLYLGILALGVYQHPDRRLALVFGGLMVGFIGFTCIIMLTDF